MSATVAAPPIARQFIWRDLMTTDPERAKAFYSALFGWTVESEDMGEMGMYDVVRNHGQGLGGVVHLDPAHGLPSHWISYLGVENVDETAEIVPRLGGAVPVPPMGIPGVGRFAVASDPTGAYFSPFFDANPGANAGVGDEGAPVGGVSWNELLTADVDAVRPFYEGVAGWTTRESEINGHAYVLCLEGDEPVAGIMRKTDDLPSSMWLIYFRVADLDRALAEVDRLGGEMVFPITDVPGFGRVAEATDPTGARFALHEATE